MARRILLFVAVRGNDKNTDVPAPSNTRTPLVAPRWLAFIVLLAGGFLPSPTLLALGT
jgi:hypothetical protein